MSDLELTVLSHRYLYYVRSTPIISDYAYDLLEADARAASQPDSLVNQPGSDCVADYPTHVIVNAIHMLEAHTRG